MFCLVWCSVRYAVLCWALRRSRACFPAPTYHSITEYSGDMRKRAFFKWYVGQLWSIDTNENETFSLVSFTSIDIAISIDITIPVRRRRKPLSHKFY